MTRDTLEQNQIPIYFAAVLLAAVVGLLAPSLVQDLTVFVAPAIAVLMDVMFLQIPFLDLFFFFSSRRRHTRYGTVTEFRRVLFRSVKARRGGSRL